jgi:hypothetical protein
MLLPLLLQDLRAPPAAPEGPLADVQAAPHPVARPVGQGERPHSPRIGSTPALGSAGLDDDARRQSGLQPTRPADCRHRRWRQLRQAIAFDAHPASSSAACLAGHRQA